MKNTLIRSVLPISLISALILFAHSAGHLEPVKNSLLAYRFKQIDRAPTGEIIVIDLDAKSIDAIGRWPWPRRLYGDLFDRLITGGATDIAFDIDVSAASLLDDDLAFEQALVRAGGLVILPVFTQKMTPRQYETRIVYNIPIDRFEQIAPTASVNVPIDADGRVRAYRLGAMVKDQPIPSFGSALAGLSGPVDGEFLIDFTIDDRQIKQYSAINVLKGWVDGGKFRGKKIIIGSSAEELGDLFWVPGQGRVPGTILHAIATETILQNRMLRETDGWLSIAGIAILGLAVLLLTRRTHWPRFLLIMGLLSVTIELVSLKLLQAMPLLVDTSAWHAGILGFAAFSVIREIDVQQVLLLMVRNETRNTQAVLDHVIADNNDGVFVVDQSGDILAVSRAGLDILRLEPDIDCTGHPVDEVLPDILSGKVLKTISDHQAGIECEDKQHEVELVLDNEDVVILEFAVTPSRLEGGLSMDGSTAPDRHIACLTFRDMTVQRQLERRLHYLATHDPLTGLANRTEFEGRLLDVTEDDATPAASCSVISIDLDRFKNVNDTLGHEFGDQLLRLVASRLLEFASSTNVIARFGGDEFALLHFGKTTKAKLGKTAQQIIDALSEPYEIFGHRAIIGASIGMVSAKGGSVRGLELIRAADVALYNAKANGGNGFCFFEPQMGLKLQLRRSLELDLRQALEREEFEIYYQPQTLLPDTGIVGVEALIRWLHPERGFISPAEFIPVAEDVGQIVEIGAWMLEEACREVASWPEPVTLAVNLSAVQFTTGDLLKTVSRALKKSGLPAEQLEFEITESLLMKETGATLTILNKLRELNSSIAMDDFGTGYSSLSYIRQYPIDKIKIDRAFVMDLPENQESLAIVHAVTAMAKSLGLKTTAEGIETAEQAKILTKAGCTYGQGYFSGKPMPARDIVEILDRKTKKRRSA